MANRRSEWCVLALMAVIGCRCGEAGVHDEKKGTAEGAEVPAQQASCGKMLCPLGEVCCNPSCGICTAPQGMCTQQFCDEAPAEAKAGEPPPPAEKLGCEDVHCQSGTHCEMVDVQCLRAPCEPVPECRPDAVLGTPKQPQPKKK